MVFQLPANSRDIGLDGSYVSNSILTQILAAESQLTTHNLRLNIINQSPGETNDLLTSAVQYNKLLAKIPTRFFADNIHET
jgi:hypothetical protein